MLLWSLNEITEAELSYQNRVRHSGYTTNTSEPASCRVPGIVYFNHHNNPTKEVLYECYFPCEEAEV